MPLYLQSVVCHIWVGVWGEGRAGVYCRIVTGNVIISREWVYCGNQGHVPKMKHMYCT